MAFQGALRCPLQGHILQHPPLLFAGRLLLSHSNGTRRLRTAAVGYSAHVSTQMQLHCSKASSVGATPSSQHIPGRTLLGEVMFAASNYFRVEVDDTVVAEHSTGQESTSASHQQQPMARRQLLCTPRALLRKLSQHVFVGDRVLLSDVDWNSGRGVVEDVLLRSSLLEEPAVANVDHVLLALALTSPAHGGSSFRRLMLCRVGRCRPLRSDTGLMCGDGTVQFDETQATRFLVAAESSGLPFTLLLNKVDLLEPEVLQQRLVQLAGWGYDRPLVVSCETGLGVLNVASVLKGRTSVVTGPSGAGKSSLINMMRTGHHRQDVIRQLADQMAMLHEVLPNHEVSADGQSVAPPQDLGNTHASVRGIAYNPATKTSPGTTGSINSDHYLHMKGECEGRPPSAGNFHGDCSCHVSAADAFQASERQPSASIIKPTMHVSLNAASAGAAATHTTLDPSAQFIAVGDLTRRGQGSHTTTAVTLICLPNGGKLADTPGFGIPHMDRLLRGQLASCFPEFVAKMEEQPCRFADCLHRSEPGCSISTGGFERLEIYYKLLEEIQEREEHDVRLMQLAKRQREGTARVKMGKGGAHRLEAKLYAPKHRAQPRDKRRPIHELE